MKRTTTIKPVLTASQEHYLEMIWHLSQQGPVRISAIARLADVRYPSVTKAVSRLADAGLVQHVAYGHVVFTELGYEAAESVVRRDNCLERLLVEVLGMAPMTAQQEVCRLEHVVSDEVLLRLETLVRAATDKRSAAWLKRLHEHIAQLTPARKKVLVGCNDPHAGSGRKLSQH